MVLKSQHSRQDDNDKYRIWNRFPTHETPLTHWGRVMHICINNLTNIGSDNGLSPGQRQAIIWTNDGILFIGPLGTNPSEILIGILSFSFKKMHLKMSSGKWRPSCLSLNVLIIPSWVSSSRSIVNILEENKPRCKETLLCVCMRVIWGL